MPKVHTNGIDLSYEITGAGEPLVLITGVGYGRWIWRYIVPGLAQHFQVIWFDNRGAGDSDKPDGPYTVPMMAADTMGLLDALKITRANVLGLSLGGFITQELNVMRPELVSKLILAGTHHGGANIVPLTPEAVKVLTDRSGDQVELLKRGFGIASAPGFLERQPHVAQELLAYRLTDPVPPAQYAAQVAAGLGMGALTEEQVAQRMRAIRVPTLLLFGEFDNVVPPGNADLMAQKIAGARIKILPNTGHIFPIEDPEATIAAVVEFLKSN